MFSPSFRATGIGNAVLLANWTRTNASDPRFADAAKDQLDFLLNVAPRSAAGAISQRESEVQLWYDTCLAPWPRVF